MNDLRFDLNGILMCQFLHIICALLLLFPITKIMYYCVLNSNITPKKVRKLMDWETRRAATICPPLKKVLKTGKALIVYYSETGNTKLVLGQVRLTSAITQESADLCFGLLHLGDHNLICGVGDDRDKSVYVTMVSEVSEAFDRADFCGLAAR